MAFDSETLRAEISAEFGQGGEFHEWFGTEGYSFRRLGRINNDDLRHMAAVARATRWNREHPERRREIQRRYWSKPEVRARQNEQARARRATKPAPVLVCRECRCQFVKRGRRGGTIPEFCRDACRQRFRYQQRTPDARRIARRAA